VKIFEINCEKYYNGYFSDKNFELDKKKVEIPMQQLISHFEIKNKQVLSIGAWKGHEEYWFYKNGCKLTLVDIDEHKKIPHIWKQ